MAVWDKSAFDQFYSSGAERWGHPNTRPQIRLHYHWYPIMQWQTSSFAPRLFSALGMNAGDSVVMIGAGFNATGAGLATLGVNVTATETSDYILAEKGETEEAEIRAEIIAVGLDPDTDKIIGPSGKADLDPLELFLEGGRASPKARGKGSILPEDMGRRGSRNAVKNALASAPRYAISEEVLNSVDDATALQICDFAASFASETGATVVHMLSPLLFGKVGAPKLNWKTFVGWRAFLDTNGFQSQLILPTVTGTEQGMTFPIDNGVLTRVVAYSGTF